MSVNAKYAAAGLIGVFGFVAAAGAAGEAAQPEAGEQAGVPVESLDEDWRPSLLRGWNGSITLGLSGSEGNTESLNFRVDVAGERLTEEIETRLSLSYRYGQDDGDENENRFEARARNDWRFEDSRWRFFVEAAYFHDEFQVWRNAASVFAGPGYEIIRNDRTQLVGRVGVGGRYEDDGPAEGFKPEGLVGLDFSHQITERQRVTARATYFPSFDDFGEFRLENQAAWEILVDPEVNLLLKVGIEHRYDSQPGDDFEENDIDYFITLGWTF